MNNFKKICQVCKRKHIIKTNKNQLVCSYCKMSSNKYRRDKARKLINDIDFEVKTTTIYGTYVFLTKAKDGKVALMNLIKKSCDFNQLIEKKESERMDISVRRI